MLRAEQTLDIIYGSVARMALPGLAEYRFGSFEMKSYDELKWRDDYQAWITDETGDVPCPGGESKKQFEKRILEAYACITGKLLLKAASNSAFVLCHGGTITYIMEYLLPGQKKFYKWQPKPGRGYTLSYISGQFQGYEKI